MNKYAIHSRRSQQAYRKRKTCEWKRAYPTKEAAFQKGQHIYQCPHCRQWHRSGAFATLVAKTRTAA